MNHKGPTPHQVPEIQAQWVAVEPVWECVDEEAHSFGDPELADGELLVGVHSSLALQLALHLYHGPFRALPIAGYGNYVHGYSNHISTEVSDHPAYLISTSLHSNYTTE